VVGGKTSSGETHLKTCPKIQHSAPAMIGGFPANTCDFEIWNRDGSIDLRGKEVTVSRGLKGVSSASATTWIAVGAFTAKDEDVKISDAGDYIIYHGVDDSQKFDVPFTAEVAYPCTLRVFVQAVCDQCGVALYSTTFRNYSRTLARQPNYAPGTTCRELIARVAELGGCIAQIRRTGSLHINYPQETGATLPKAKYKTLLVQPALPPVTAVSIGHEGYDDDVIYPATAGANDTWWKIKDNPFADLDRKSWATYAYTYLHGMAVAPFELTEFVDDFMFDLNDRVQIETKSGELLTTTILGISTQNRIRSNFKADVQDNGTVNHAIAGSIRQRVKTIDLQVNHVEGRMDAIAAEVDEMGKKVTASISLTAEQIEFVFAAIQDNESLWEEYIRFSGALMELGKRGNDISARLTNDRLEFLQNGTPIAYILRSRLHILDAEIERFLYFKHAVLYERSNGNLCFASFGG
jgi:hypothetical protein